MDLELGPKESRWAILLTPGPILAILGILILTVSFVIFSANSPGSDVDSLIEAQGQSGARIKSMLAMIAGVVCTIAGALLALVTFKNR